MPSVGPVHQASSPEATTTGGPSTSLVLPHELRTVIELDFQSLPAAVDAAVVSPFGPWPETLGFKNESLPVVPAGFAPLGELFAISDPANSRLAVIDRNGAVVDSIPFGPTVDDVVNIGQRAFVVAQTGTSPTPAVAVVETDGSYRTLDIVSDPQSDLIAGELVTFESTVGMWVFSIGGSDAYDGLYELATDPMESFVLPTEPGLCDSICFDLLFRSENELSIVLGSTESLLEFTLAGDDRPKPVVSLDSAIATFDSVALLIKASAQCERCEAYFFVRFNRDTNAWTVRRLDLAADSAWDPMIRSRLRIDDTGHFWILDIDPTELTLSRILPGS